MLDNVILNKSRFNTFKKKYIKLKNNPKIFFYDWLGNNIQKPLIECQDTINQSNKKYLDDGLEIGYIGFNYSEYKNKGIENFIKENINDPISNIENDLSKIYLWAGKIEVFVSLLEWIHKFDNADIKLYTEKGGINFSSKNHENFNKVYLIKMLKKPSNFSEFFIEIKNQFLYKNFKVYGYKVDSENNILFQSNNTYMKKININKFKDSFHKFIEFDNTIKEPIDVVYTWVNKDDLTWKNLWNESFPEQKLDSDRFSNNDELKYSLRSINQYMPWVRNIFILSNCSMPEWLQENEKIKWIDHKNLISDEFLPTFNSHAIETNLHKISDISEIFIYFNDDVFLGNPIDKATFVNNFRQTASFFEDYNMVDLLDVEEKDHDYIKASKNSQKSLRKIYPNYTASKLHKHVPTVLNKTILKSIEKEFKNEILMTRKNKLRHNSDINLTSFLYHHYCVCSSQNFNARCENIIVRPNNIDKIKKLNYLPYKFLCFNDGGGTSNNNAYKSKVKDIFNYYFSLSAPWEK